VEPREAHHLCWEREKKKSIECLVKKGVCLSKEDAAQESREEGGGDGSPRPFDCLDTAEKEELRNGRIFDYLGRRSKGVASQKAPEGYLPLRRRLLVSRTLPGK